MIYPYLVFIPTDGQYTREKIKLILENAIIASCIYCVAAKRNGLGIHTTRRRNLPFAA